ncbi:E3 ubiquitin-protein ligase Bre1 [Armadillidium nasatum]|uniref:E3 ubiquitin protein ligase n=1 Tax=Armadillidium nasatum TaxID=96803 RepID=A0A5N5TPM4_9CRUS|nr:E3 ubiquitin-protein ligase Bre1 [Armadillidium nasatum]
MSKRPLEDGGGSGTPPPKNLKVQFEPVLLGAISTLDEMDMKVLRFQNHKLYQRLDQRKRVEEDLKSRIEQLEKRQTQSDDVLTIINRYWNQFNEDIRLMLQRYDAETADESETKNESEATTSFLTQLSTWDRTELDEKLANRVQVSRRAVAKIIQAFDRLHQRNEKVTKSLKGEGLEEAPSLEESVKEMNEELQKENKSLHAQNLSLHEKQHLMSLKAAELEEKVQAMETERAEMQNRYEDLEYDLNKTRNRCEKVESQLAEACQKLKVLQDEGVTAMVQAKNTAAAGNGAAGSKLSSSMSAKKIEELSSELEEQKELSAKRLDELEKKTNEYKECLKEVERLKMDLRQLPESIIVETTEYKCLQSQFSVLYNESMQLKTQLEETRHQLQTSKNTHLRQIEQMESEELLCQKKLRTEVIQLEDMLAQVRKEYEMLRIEFEQNLAANEQTGPINREMRHLITSLQNHIQQLKGEIHRYKRKYKESVQDSTKVKKDLEECQQKLAQRTRSSSVSERQDSVSSDKGDGSKDQVIKEEGNESCDSAAAAAVSSDGHGGGGHTEEGKGGEGSDAKKEENEDDGKGEDGDKKDSKKDLKKEVKLESGKDGSKPGVSAQAVKDSKENEMIKNLKAELKKAHAESRELKLLLDMYKAQGVGKEQRDKVQLMAAEKKARQEVEELKSQVKKLQESKREERKKLADEEAIRKIKMLDEMVHSLQRQVAAQKQEEEALINEMEVTGQAFEETQDQNVRLIQQLREKDNANFKLMSERIKSNQINKLANEERDNLQEQVSTLSTQVDAQNQVVRKLEEKERLLQNTLATVEKELQLRQQALEMHKRKAIESAQSAADLKLHLEKYHAQMKEAQQVVAEKTMALEQEAYKYKRVQEETASLKRKVERAKKFEMADRADEVLMEEIKEYKDILTCPSCKVKRKDAVLIKCFHVFCFDCLRTRYETRQRKCPKCNAAFGANDYHRLYLS